MEWEADPSEVDDAPKDADVPADYHDDEDGGIYDDEDRGPQAPRSSWVPWVRLSIFLRDGQLGYTADLPGADNPGLERSLFHLGAGWTQTARTLIDSQGVALRCSTPLAALLSLAPYPMSELERSVGQGSRDRRVVISTPFGLAPLWLFAQGRRDNLLRDLERIGRAVIDRKVTVLTPTLIERVVTNPSVKPDTIRRAHGQALLAVARNPAIVARHRALWPLTTMSDLLDDLGLIVEVGRSAPVAALALVGAFDPPDLLIAASAHARPRREVTP